MDPNKLKLMYVCSHTNLNLFYFSKTATGTSICRSGTKGAVEKDDSRCFSKGKKPPGLGGSYPTPDKPHRRRGVTGRAVVKLTALETKTDKQRAQQRGHPSKGPFIWTTPVGARGPPSPTTKQLHQKQQGVMSIYFSV